MARKSRPWFDRQKNAWTVWFNGKRHRLAEGRKNKRAAEDRLDALRYEASKNPLPDDEDQTVASIIESYLDIAGRQLAPNTLAIKTYYLQSFAEAHGWRRVVDAKKIHLTQWLQDHPDWKSDWTISHALTVVQTAFNWAVDEEVIARNPFKGKRHRRGDPRRPLTVAEFQALLRASDGRHPHRRPSPGARFRQILIFLSFTGARPGEACGLCWSDIDLDNAVIVLKKHKTSRTQKTPKPRIIPLHPVVVKLLIAIRRREEGQQVFLTFRRTPWDKNSLGQRIRRARDKAGIPDDAKLYGTRHAFGTRAIVNGVDLKTLSELLGHTTTKMSEHYVHLATQQPHLARAMQLVNARRRDA